jgi:hypothetical protein
LVSALERNKYRHQKETRQDVELRISTPTRNEIC